MTITALPLSPFITDRQAYLDQMAISAVEDALVEGLQRGAHLRAELRAEAAPAFLRAPSPEYLAATQRDDASGWTRPILDVLASH